MEHMPIISLYLCPHNVLTLLGERRGGEGSERYIIVDFLPIRVGRLRCSHIFIYYNRDDRREVIMNEWKKIGKETKYRMFSPFLNDSNPIKPTS